MSISLSGFPAYLAIMTIILVIAVIPMYILSKLRRKTYEFSRQYDTVVKTEYMPPLNLTPAEIGYLSDAKFSKQEFYATILDLEQRGYINIEKNTIYSFKLERLQKEIVSLHKHEQLVLEEFSNTNSLIVSNSLNLKKFRQMVIASLAQKGLVKQSRLNINFLVTRIIILFLLFNTLLTLLLTFTGDSSASERLIFFFLTPLLFTPLTLPVSIVLGFIYHKIVGETGLWTKKMKNTWVEIAGYKYFIEQVELDNIKFESSELKTKTKIDAFPYAVALGLDTDWEKRFSNNKESN